MVSIALYTGLIAYLEKEVFKLPDTSYVKNLNTMHQLLGMVISLLLVFRTNTAYDRWWEGRKLWGSLVNNSRNLAMKLDAFLPASCHQEKKFLTELITAYPFALKQHLVSKQTAEELFEEGISEKVAGAIDKKKHVPNQIAGAIIKHIAELQKESKITETQMWMMQEEIKGYADICGACERIKNTPIPFSYSTFLKKFIFFYIMTLPFGYVFILGYYSIPVTVFIFYVLASLELIAEEIEDPFGTDSNDLPMQKIAENIKKHVQEILH